MKGVTPQNLYLMFQDGQEIALLDIRTPAAFERGHPLLSVNVPGEQLRQTIGRLVPRTSTRVILCGDTEVPTAQASDTLASLGYDNFHDLSGGVDAWVSAGFPVYSGTYTINNAFALCVERHYGTPRMTAEALKSKIDSRTVPMILDSRPFDEFNAASIPGAINVPLAELPYRIKDIAPDPDREIVVNCGGRARAILGAQSLINAGAPNPVSALYYGTMGWDLAGHELARNVTRTQVRHSDEAKAWAYRTREPLARRFGVRVATLAELDTWRHDPDRTTYVIDVRSHAEYKAEHLEGSVWVPGGQLAGVTEDHIATRNARVCLVDNDGVRATLTATWLVQMGWSDVTVLDHSVGADVPTDLEPKPASPSVTDPNTSGTSQSDPKTMAARHAGYRQTIEARERLPDQLANDDTLRFKLPAR